MLLILSFILGGCTSQQARLLEKRHGDVLKSYREQVADTIDDPKRAEQLIAIGEDLHLQIRRETKVILEMAAELKKLNSAYDTPRKELEAALQNLNSQRAKMRDSILLARAEAMSLTTPAEWQKLINRRGTLLELIKETPGFL